MPIGTSERFGVTSVFWQSKHSKSGIRGRMLEANQLVDEKPQVFAWYRTPVKLFKLILLHESFRRSIASSKYKGSRLGDISKYSSDFLWYITKEPKGPRMPPPFESGNRNLSISKSWRSIVKSPLSRVIVLLAFVDTSDFMGLPKHPSSYMSTASFNTNDLLPLPYVKQSISQSIVYYPARKTWLLIRLWFFS